MPHRLSAIAAVALAEKAGVPAGVINLVMGDSAAIGKALCSHPAVRVLSFTGSTEVGKKLAAQCAMTVKKNRIGIGRNAPFIVFDDADLAAAAKHAPSVKVSQRRTNLRLRQPILCSRRRPR